MKTLSFAGLLLSFIPLCIAVSCVEATQQKTSSVKSSDPMNQTNSQSVNQNPKATTLDTATFGAGCFWCVEAQFQMLDGVVKVESGFSGGHVKNPSYREVCEGTTGHAEVCQITYDTTKLTYADMLEAFWKSHDPTQMNRQGNDVGTQYRSVIFYHNAKQQRLA